MYYSRPNETLEDHVKNVIEICKSFNININLLTTDKIIKDMFYNTIKLHDAGKTNPYFQYYISHNKYRNSHKKDHSIVSTVYYICNQYSKYVVNIECENKRKTIKRKKYLCKYILLFSYNIYKHHGSLGNLDNINDYLDKLINHYNENKDMYENLEIDVEVIKYLKNLNLDSVELEGYKSYLLFKLNYSALVKADYMSVYKFYNNKYLKENRIDNELKTTFINIFNNNEITKNIYKYKNCEIELSKINRYRSDMFLESESNLIKNKDNIIFYLEAPTGSGKSNMGLNLSLKLLDDTFTKIVYTSPLNNISRQMYEDVINKLKDDENVVIINSKECILETDEYSKDYLNYQTFNYPFIVTSNVRLFDIFFGVSRNSNLALEGLRN